MSDERLRERTYGQWWDSAGEFVTVPLAELEHIGIAGYESAGASPEDAKFLLNINLDKAIQGDHARGLGLLPEQIQAAKNGALDLRAKCEIVRERGATAVVSAPSNASGRLLCRFAVDLAIEKAQEFGIGWVSAQASGQILTPYVKRAADAGMVSMVMVQSFPTVAPLGGFGPLLGNAPIAFGVPAGERDPVIIDMSCTQSSASGVFQAARQEEQLPEGFLYDERGAPTTDAAQFPKPEALKPTGVSDVRGTLAPLGNNHKGYALIFIVGLLSSVLSDTSPPWELYYELPKRGTYGTLFMVLDPTAFGPGIEDFKGQVDGFIDRVKASPKQDGIEEILYPGEKSQRLKTERRDDGRVAIPASHYHLMTKLATELGLERQL